VGPKGFLRHPPLTRNFLPMRSFGPTKRRAYLAYSYEFYGSKTIKDLKGKLRSKGIEPVDPYEIALGTEPEIAELDMKLIDSCEIFIFYIPPNWESTEIGMELMYAILRGKEIWLYGKLKDKPFLNWLKAKILNLEG